MILGAFCMLITSEATASRSARPALQVGESDWMPNLAAIDHFGGGSYAVATTPGRVYAGQGPVLAIYEDREDGDLRLVGRSSVLPGMIGEIQARGDLLVLSIAESAPAPFGDSMWERWPRGGLALVDAGQAQSPRLLAYLPDLARIAVDLGWTEGAAIREDGLGIAALQMELAPPWLFVATEAGLLSFDLSDPSRPRALGRYAPQGGGVWGLAYRAPLLYVNGGGKPRVLDMSDPARPVELGCLRGFRNPPEEPIVPTRIPLPTERPELPPRPTRSPPPTVTPRRQMGLTSAMSGSGRDATRSWNQRLQEAVLPASPGQSECIDFPIEGGLLAAGADRLALSWLGEVLFFDLSAAHSPELVDVSVTESLLVDIEFDGRWLHGLATHGALSVIDAGLDQAFELPLARLDLPGQGAQLALAGNRAFVATGEGGLRVVSLVHPQAPRELRAQVGAPHPLQIEIQDGLVYLVDATNGLQVFDLDGPHGPMKLGAYRMPQARRLALDGDRAYLQSRTSEIRLLDLGRPGQPRELGPIELGVTLESVEAMQARDGRLYLSTVRDDRQSPTGAFSRWIEVYEVDQPGSAPDPWRIEIGDIGGAYSLLVEDGQLFSLGEQGLAIFRLDPPGAPTRLSDLPVGGSFESMANLAVSGGRAYMTRRRDSQLFAIDIAEPEAPTVLTQLEAGSDRYHGLIADPGRLTYIGSKVAHQGGSIEKRGVNIVDMDSEGASIRRISRTSPNFGGSETFDRSGQTESFAPDLARWGDRLYLADPRSGVFVYREYEGPRIFLPVLARTMD